ncbi:hypothetical protein [Desulfoscipio geothermicus]|uniref:hypothetical protein n=1 Tax=Desulfoscipio geothermicus TaxID=39060 RepID=UPI0010426E7D|nr:hypothetical protein [Desulfoscipio geothermicus]
MNSQRKVRVPELPGPAWWFDCSGHAGYILVASANEVPKELARFAADGILVWDTSWVKQFGDQFNRITVFRFEEDCDWSVLEVLYPEVARWSVCDIERGWAKAEYLDKNRALLAQQRLQSPEEIDLLVVKRLQTACKSIREWQPPEVTEKLLDLAKSA